MALQPIFTRAENKLNAVFALDSVIAAFSAGIPAALLQAVRGQTSAPLRTFYEINTPGNVGGMYYAVTRPNSSLSLSRMMGPKNLMAAFFAKFGNACAAKSNTMRFQATTSDCSDNLENTPAGFEASGCVLENYGFVLQAEQSLISEDFSLRATKLEYDGS